MSDDEIVIDEKTRGRVNGFFAFMRLYHPIFSLLILVGFLLWLNYTPQENTLHVDSDGNTVVLPGHEGFWEPHDLAMNITNICDDLEKPSFFLIFISLFSLEAASVFKMIRRLLMRRGCGWKTKRVMDEIVGGFVTFRNFMVYMTLIYYLYHH
jgi:hypothetical protein